MKAAKELGTKLGVTTACKALGVPRSSFYRQRWGRRLTHPRRRPRPPRTLTKPQEKEVLDVLHCEAYVDKAPAQVWASLLDQGTVLCCVRTMYRILKDKVLMQ